MCPCPGRGLSLIAQSRHFGDNIPVFCREIYSVKQQDFIESLSIRSMIVRFFEYFLAKFFNHFSEGDTQWPHAEIWPMQFAH
jgi:hypothetical protein